jgi:hypothetical protein
LNPLNLLIAILKEQSGVSAMRVMSLLSLTTGAIIALIAVYRNCDLNGSVPMVTIFVGAAFGGKVWQKYAEVEKSK